MKFHAPPDRQHRRQEMTDDIIQQVREAVRDELADAPECFRREQLEEIENEIHVPYRRNQTYMLSTEGREGSCSKFKLTCKTMVTRWFLKSLQDAIGRRTTNRDHVPGSQPPGNLIHMFY